MQKKVSGITEECSKKPKKKTPFEERSLTGKKRFLPSHLPGFLLLELAPCALAPVAAVSSGQSLDRSR
jgi:hypothetical protein